MSQSEAGSQGPVESSIRPISKQELGKVSTQLDADIDPHESRHKSSDRENAKVHIDKADAIEINKFCSTYALHKSQVWQLIRLGELAATTEHGKVFVYGYVDSDLKISGQDSSDPITFSGQPQKKISLAEPEEPFNSGEYIDSEALVGATAASSTDLALLLDHLSLAKEENKEILRLTQDSIARMTKMTEQVVEMKDQLISIEKEKNEQLRVQLENQEKLILKLKQDKEDLEMLANMLKTDED